MANQVQLDILRRGTVAWNRWRGESPALFPDLFAAELSGVSFRNAHFGSANLSNANLRGADLSRSNLTHANLSNANLRNADLSQSNLTHANLGGADLSGTNLSRADFRGADLSGADLNRTNLTGTNLSLANLSGANLGKAAFDETIFGNTDLSAVIDLDTCEHLGPSTLDHRTIARSGRLPLKFFRGCGLPDTLIDYLPSLLNEPIQFYSCFISYSTKDQEFADRLYADLQNKGVRCWFAPHDMQSGKKIHEQIDEAIRVYQRLLLILSRASMESEWVETEIAKARKRELQEKRRMLFPVRLVDFETLRDWECFDADAGKDSAREIREFYIPDFSSWKDHDCYRREFEKLLRDLKPERKTPDTK
jgi:TIR domain/Pentapeptide repeats (8 copies)